MAKDDKVILTPDEAISLLAEGEYSHNYANPRGMLIGCDYERDGVVKALREAKQIEIGGDACKSMRHPLAVWDAKDRLTFFEADMEKVAALEEASYGHHPI